MKKENWTVSESSTRPAGSSDRCFYCGRLLGEQHTEDCVIRSRTVVVDFTFRTVLAVPEHWDEERIRFHYNDGTWCADNILSELNERSGELGCNCNICEAKYVKEADENDERRYGLKFVNMEDS